MYEVPHNTKPLSKWPVLIISLYYIFVGLIAAISSISFFVTMIYSDMLNSNRLMLTLWFSLILIANASRLGVFIGLLSQRLWAYRGSMVIETLMVINAGYILFFSKPYRLNWPIIISGIIALLILGYLFRLKVRHAFFTIKE